MKISISEQGKATLKNTGAKRRGGVAAPLFSGLRIVATDEEIRAYHRLQKSVIRKD